MTWVKKSILTLSITAAVLGGACSWVLFTAESFETTADKVERLNTFEAKVAAVKLALKTKSRSNGYTPLLGVHLRLPAATGSEYVKAYARIDSAPKTDVFVGYSVQIFEEALAKPEGAAVLEQHAVLHRCEKEGAPSLYREMVVHGSAFPYDSLLLNTDYYLLTLFRANASRATVYDETGYANGLTLRQDFNARFGALRSDARAHEGVKPPPRAIESCALSAPQMTISEIVAQRALSAKVLENVNLVPPPPGWSMYAAGGVIPFNKREQGQALQWVGSAADAPKADEIVESLGAFFQSKGYAPWEVETQKSRIRPREGGSFTRVAYRHGDRTTELSVLKVPGSSRVTLITF